MNPSNNDAAEIPPAPASAPAAGPRLFPNAPAAPRLPSAAPKTTGTKSTLKILVPIVALVAVIFGITFFAQYTPPSEDPLKPQKGDNNEPPLRFFSAKRTWSPPSFQPPAREQPLDFRGMPLLAPAAFSADPNFPFEYSLQDRAYQGFFEVKDDAAGLKHAASFWFENLHQHPVSLRLKSVSCTSCSGGRIAAIPPDVTRQILQMSRISALPQGFVSGLPVGMVGPAANLDESHLRWEQYVFRDTPDATFHVPPAGENPSGWTPQWGILQLQFSVGVLGPKQLEAKFETTVEGTKIQKEDTFSIFSFGVNAFDLTRSTIDLGELNDKSEPRQFEVILYSSTRGHNRMGPGEMGDLAVPSVSIRMPLSQGGDPGEFVKISPPERIPDHELTRVAEMIAEESQRQKVARVEAAYRFIVTVNPQVKNQSIDIGQLERDIWFGIPGSQERLLQVKGMVSGAVWLDNNLSSIDMQGFPLMKGASKRLTLVSARRDAVIELDKEHSRPNYLKIFLEKDPNPPSADRGYYKLTVEVPSSKESIQVRPGTWSGEIVLKVNGPTIQRVRIPIKGRIELR